MTRRSLDIRQRESIWSVPFQWLPFYLAIFTLLSLTGIIAYSWHIISQGDKSAVQIFYTILIGSAQIGVGSAIVTFNVMEVVVVLAGIIDQRFYKPRRERMKAEAMAQGMAEGIAQGMAQGKAQGMAQGKAEGIAQGRAEAMAELQKRWEDWNRRRIEAGDVGFDEPPPTFDSNS